MRGRGEGEEGGVREGKGYWMKLSVYLSKIASKRKVLKYRVREQESFTSFIHMFIHSSIPSF
jgi:hypothetical protein